MALPDHLVQLEAAGLIQLAATQPEVEYFFRHALIREAVYESTLRADRREVHRLVGETLEQLYADRPDELSEALAHHYVQASLPHKAIPHLAQAADRASRRYANQEALDYYQQLGAVLTEPAEQINAQLRTGAVLEVMGRWPEAERCYQQALSIADRSAAAARPSCHKALGVLARNRGDYDRALDWLQQAETGWKALGDRAGLRQTLADMAVVLVRKGEQAQAKRHLQESLALARDLGDQPGMAFALNWLGNIAAYQGDYLAARSLYEESLAFRQQLDDKIGMAASFNNLGSAAYGLGDYTAARAWHEKSLHLKRLIGDRWGIAISLDNLGGVATELGDYQLARRLYQETLALFRELGDKRGMANSLSNLGNVAGHQADYAAASVSHAESLALRREIGDRWGTAVSLGNLGLAACGQGDYAAARAWFEASLALRRDIGDKRGLVYSLSGLGVAAAGLGYWPVAARLLAAAATLCAAIQMKMESTEQRFHERARAAVQAGLSAEAFTACWAEGESMTAEAAVGYALAPEAQ